MTRTRTGEKISAQRINKSGTTYPTFTFKELMVDEPRGPGNCNHSKVIQTINGQITKPGHPSHPTTYNTYVPYGVDRLSHAAYSRMTVPMYQLANKLNRNKIPSTNQANALVAYREIDDTVALFTKKFWSSLTYGKVTWGVLPFVSDVKHVLKTIKNAEKSLDLFDYSDEVKINLSQPAISNSPEASLVGLFRFSGKGSVPPSPFRDIDAALDRLAIHPDTNTAWDGLPLSFAVDYIFPIGKALEDIRESGWIRNITFSGWATWDLTLESSDYTAYPAAFNHQLKSTTHHYNRSYVVNRPLSLDIQAFSDDRRPEVPDFTECFNLLYLLLSGKKK